MIKYICKNCNDLECETSICPVCHGRTEAGETKVFWSKKYNVPSFDEINPITGEKCFYIGTDLRPVFPEERLLIESLLDKPMFYAESSVWNVGGSNYIVDGEKLSLNFKELRKKNSKTIIEKINEYKEKNKKYEDEFLENKTIQRFVEINTNRCSVISTEAIDYIKKQSEAYDLNSMFVSFSGGKDSTVTSDLVTRALGTKGIIHIYGDTTLEYPETKNYIQRLKSSNRETPFLIAKNTDQDFNNLCEVIGPPSRVMRWCCTVFKTGAITKKIEMTFKDKSKILSFQGIRRNESKSRNKYKRETNSPKIAKQLAASPIIDWIDFDVWLYILTNKLDFNKAYRLGFSRVGCWCCPNNSGWTEFLASIYMEEEHNVFYDMLYRFAKNVGKEDWKDYIDNGNWKARQGGNGLNASKNAIVSFKPCALDENAMNFELTKPIDESLYTFFKPFGKLDFNIGNKRLNEVYILDRKTNEPILKLSGRNGKSELKVTIIRKTGIFKNMQSAESLVKDQITKFQTCIACSGCQSACKYNALKVVNMTKGNVSNGTVLYTIDEKKCVGCLHCVDHYSSGCYMKKVLRTKEGGK